MNDKTLNEQIFASIMHGCPELSKGALGKNAQLREPELALPKMRWWFHRVLPTERGYQLAYWAPTAPYAQRVGLCYKLNKQFFVSIMHGCPDLSKGTLGQNAQLWKPELVLLLRCAPGFIKFCLLLSWYLYYSIAVVLNCCVQSESRNGIASYYSTHTVWSVNDGLSENLLEASGNRPLRFPAGFQFFC